MQNSSIDSALHGDFKLTSIVVFHSPTEFLMSVIGALIAPHQYPCMGFLAVSGLVDLTGLIVLVNFSVNLELVLVSSALLSCALTRVPAQLVTMPNRSFHVVEKQAAV